MYQTQRRERAGLDKQSRLWGSVRCTGQANVRRWCKCARGAGADLEDSFAGRAQGATSRLSRGTTTSASR